MMKNDCGHPIASENSVLRCDDCEAERRKTEDSALWNAALEAAAKLIEPDICHGCADHPERIRALKRPS